MSTTRKFLRNMDKVTLSEIGKATKLQKVVSAVTAMGFVLQPVAAMASVITRADNNTNLAANGSVTNIFAEKIVGNVAMNNFEQFQLSANEIANMYFKTAANETKEANSLVNFVNSRIDINGTVNAIQKNKIGGNLFFLSSQGMVVGKTGVINAGSLYVATPNAKKLDQFKDNFTENIVQEDKLEDAMFYSVPINASGTITVLGKINAVNDVHLRAPKIGIGKNVSGDTQYDDVQLGGDKYACFYQNWC